MKFLWQDCVVVTDPAALAAIMGRGEGAMDKAHVAYAPINKMCDPHGNANLLTSAADDSWKAVRKAVAVSFSVQVRGCCSREGGAGRWVGGGGGGGRAEQSISGLVGGGGGGRRERVL
jgi:hypothetical protein